MKRDRKRIDAVCKKYGVSRSTLYRWKKKYEENGLKGLEDKRFKK